MAELEFDVVQRARIKHQAADSLSRMDMSSSDTVAVEDDLPTYVVETMLGSIEEGEMD